MLLDLLLEFLEDHTHEEPVAVLFKEVCHPLGLLHIFVIFELLDIVALVLDGHMHLGHTIISPCCVLIVVVLVLAHIAASHLGVLSHEFLVEVGVELVVDDVVVLN